MRWFIGAFPALASLALLSGGCSKSDPSAAGASAAASAMPATSASAAAAVSEIDPGITAALVLVARCEGYNPGASAIGPDGKLDLEKLDSLFCPYELAWLETVNQVKAQDDYRSLSHVRLARSCAASGGHASARVRRAAYDCVADHPDGIADPRAMIETLFARFDEEKDSDVRKAMWKAIGALDPTQHGLAKRATELARKHASDDDSLAAALQALAPRSEYVATTPEALAYAVENAKAGRGGEHVVALVTKSAMLPSEACEVYAAMLASEGPDWHAALEGLQETDGFCKTHAKRTVDAIVARTVLAKTKPEAWQSDANTALRDIGKLELDAASRSKLRTALATLSKEQRQAYGSDWIADVLEDLR